MVGDSFTAPQPPDFQPSLRDLIVIGYTPHGVKTPVLLSGCPSGTNKTPLKNLEASKMYLGSAATQVGGLAEVCVQKHS
jgi:hypothetical protein